MTNGAINYRYSNTNRILEMVSDNMAQSFLRKQKTKEYQKAQFKKTGVLNTNTLFNYKISDDLFVRKQIDHTGKSYGFVMLLDMSGSMADIYLQCAIQIMLLVKFCRKIGVPFEVYGFLDSNSGRGPFETAYGRSKLLQFFSSKTPKRDFEEHCKAFYYLAENATGRHRTYLSCGYSLGGTPMNNALHKTFSVIDDFNLTYNRDINHLIVVTDGQPSDSVFEKTERYRQNFSSLSCDGINILKVNNKSYFYNPDDFFNKLKQDPNIPDITCKQRVEQYFLISSMKKHFGSKLKCHRFFIENYNSKFNQKEEKLIQTNTINSPLYYDSETFISTNAFKCFGSVFHENFWEDNQIPNSDVSIARQLSKLGKKMEKTLTKTKELRSIAEKIVDLLVQT